MKTRITAVIATLASTLPPLTVVVRAQGFDSLEQAVIVAAITHTRAVPSGSWILLGDRTATFQCDPPLPGIVNLAGCNGMRTKARGEDETVALIRQRIPTVPDSMLTEFREKNKTSITLTQPLPLSAKQVLWSPSSTTAVPTDLGGPTLAIELSRVSFDVGHQRALVYISAISWTDQSQSYGEYVYLEHHNGKWSVAGRVRTWDLLPK